MLPFGGQGANQAIEDAGALGYLLTDISPETITDLPSRLAAFEKVRIKRASLIQTLSKVRVGKEKEIEEEVKVFAEPEQKVPSTFAERTAHAFGHNVLKESGRVMEGLA